MILKRNLHWALYLLFVASCAKQTSPTGGPKDTIPPVLVNSIPPGEAINFKGKSLLLNFSEMIVLNNPKEQLIITPTIGKDFEITSKKNSVTIDFEAPLNDSTTYSFNFRDAIQDITEKNPVRNLQVAFSTGPYIDSLSISGNTYDLLKGKSLKDITVAIHLPNDTFSILQHPATFFTKTNDKGEFKIDHLKPGSYYIYAIDDKNRNLIADSRTEAYGFHSDPIYLKKDTSGISVALLKLDARPLKITSARPYNTYFNIKTTKNIKNFNITTHDSTALYYSFGEDQSNIKIYNTLTNQTDSLAFHLTAVDSIENEIDTTLYAKHQTREIIPEPFDMILKSTSIIADKGLLNATITFTKPVNQINFDSLYFQLDSTTRINFSSEDLTWEKQTNKLTVQKTVDKTLFTPKTENPTPTPTTANTLPKEKTESNTPPLHPPITNQLYIGKAAFISVENDSSKRVTQKVTPLKTEDLSRIIYEIGTDHENLVIQLLDKNFNILEQIQDKTHGQFEDLTAGDYLLRVVIDKNNNGKWDPGNYLLNQEPEPVIYYKDEKNSFIINLKSNWDFELAPMLISY